MCLHHLLGQSERMGEHELRNTDSCVGSRFVEQLPRPILDLVQRMPIVCTVPDELRQWQFPMLIIVIVDLGELGSASLKRVSG